MEAATELGSGVCMVLGLLTPFVTAMLIGDMLVAIFEVLASKGSWSQNGGFEYNLVSIAMFFCARCQPHRGRGGGRTRPHTDGLRGHAQRSFFRPRSDTFSTKGRGRIKDLCEIAGVKFDS
jgi:hypothetical protein